MKPDHSKKISRVKAAMLAASASVAALGMSEAAVTAVNFLGDGYGALGASVTADAYGVATGDWANVDVGDGAGSSTVNGIGFSWTANNDWAQASAIPGTGGASEVNYGYIDDTGDNATLTIAGLSAWLSSVPGATGYTIQLVQSSDNAAGFTDSPVFDSDGGALLGTLINSTTGSGAIGGATDALTLSSDTLFVDPNIRAGSARGTISAVILTSVPEPSSSVLLGLGGLALFLRRRK